MEIEDDGFVFCKEGFEFVVAKTVGVVKIWDQFEEIDDVDETDLYLWQVLAEQCDGGKGFLCWDISARCHDHIWLLVCAVGGEFPNSDAFGAMGNGVVHVEVLKMVLLVGDDDVDVVGAAKTVVGYREKAVGVWW